MTDYILTPEYLQNPGNEPDTSRFDLSIESKKSKSNGEVLLDPPEGNGANESGVPERLEGYNLRISESHCDIICCRDVENFKCLNKISEGTYGTVYRAVNRDTGEIVALKHIKYHDVQWKEGFPITYLREISILLELKHPNILSVREIVTNKRRDQYYMVMEYVEHELKTLLHDGKINFTLSERKCLLKQLLEGTNYMHQNWVMHRDLKTTNILYNNQGVLKICDFGMARKFGNPIKTYTQNVVTHWYRAPELFLGQKEYTEKTDMWSVGCIFAEIILSKPLFMGTNDNDTLDKIFRLCGSPTEENWPGFSQLPAIANNLFTINSYKPTFHKVFNVGIMGGMLHGSTCMTELGLDLLKKMLQIDPNQRISAKDALIHPYLTQEKPTTKTVELMPTLRDTNCIDRNKQGKSENEEHNQSSRFMGRIDPAKFLSMMKQEKSSRKN